MIQLPNPCCQHKYFDFKSEYATVDYAGNYQRGSGVPTKQALQQIGLTYKIAFFLPPSTPLRNFINPCMYISWSSYMLIWLPLGQYR